MSLHTRRVFAAAAVLAVIGVQSADAGIYKCTDSDGNFEYSQTPCATDAETVSATGGGTRGDSDSKDCNYAARFAGTVAGSMKTGVGSSEVFDRYGGLDSVSDGTIGVINYVYQFRLNDEVSVERIAALTRSKCLARSLGEVSCETLPLSFTDSFGGCNREDEEETAAENQVSEQPSTPDMPSTEQRASLDDRRTPLESSSADGRCKENYEAEIDRINEQMRRGYTSAQGDAYRQQLRDLRGKISRCP